MDKLNRYTNQEQEPDHECGFVSENTREWKPRVRFEVVSNAPEKYHDSQLRSAIMVYLYDTEVGAIVHQSFFVGMDTTGTDTVFKLNPDTKEDKNHGGGLLVQDINEIARIMRTL